MDNPLVSICVPSLNTGRFIDRCLDAVHRQSYQNWECIVCDSGSTDGTQEVLRRWAAVDPRFKIFPVPREGIYPGWNECLRRAKGEFVYIATSDDITYPDCVRKCVAFLVAHPRANFVHFPVDLVDEAHTPSIDLFKRLPGVRYYGPWAEVGHLRSGGEEQLRMLMLGSVYISITSVFFRNNQALAFPTQFGKQGDYFFFLDFLPGKVVGYLPEVLATWRRHPDQATEDEESRLSKQIDYLRRWGEGRKLSKLQEIGVSMTQRRLQLFRLRRRLGKKAGRLVHLGLNPLFYPYLRDELSVGAEISLTQALVGYRGIERLDRS